MLEKETLRAMQLEIHMDFLFLYAKMRRFLTKMRKLLLLQLFFLILRIVLFKTFLKSLQKSPILHQKSLFFL